MKSRYPSSAMGRSKSDNRGPARGRAISRFEPLEARALLTGTLLYDFGPQAEIGDFTEFNGVRYFVVSHKEQFGADAPTYHDLWKTDGTFAGTQRLTHQLNVGVLTGYNDRVVFFTQDQTDGVRLWSSDGTPAGTQVITQISTSPHRYFDAQWRDFAELNGRLIFLANDGTHGAELWTTDGTAAGTFMLKDIAPGAADAQISSLMVHNGSAYFTANDGPHGREPWVTDGTPDGTILIGDIAPGWEHSWSSFFVFGNQVMFNAWDGIYSASGDRLVSSWDVFSFVHGNILLYSGWDRPEPEEDPFRLPEDPPIEYERYRPLSSMTTTGGGDTLHPDLSVDLANGVWAGSTFYFPANDGVHGHELWMTDGVTARMVKDITPGSNSSDINQLKDINGVVYFVRNHQLWRSDGTTAGTVAVTAFAGSEALTYEPLGDGLLIGYRPNGANSQLWKSAGRAGTHVKLREFGLISLRGAGFAGRHYFKAYDSAFGWELWSTDGTASGTRRETDIFPGVRDTEGQSRLHLSDLTVHNGALLYPANGTEDVKDTAQLWSLDGQAPSGNEPYSDAIGNSLAAAHTVLVEATAFSFADAIGGGDTDDLYKFTLDWPRFTTTFSLTGLRANADLELIHDRDNDGVIDVGEVIARSANGGLAAESFSLVLPAGTYHLRVRAGMVPTTYTLNHSGAGLVAAPGFSLQWAMPLGRLRGNRFVYDLATHRPHYIRFVLKDGQQFSFGATLVPLGNGADLELVRDANANGIIEQSEILATSANPGAAQDRIAGTLRRGVYYLRIGGITSGTPYILRLSASAIADPGLTFATAHNIGALNTAATGIFGSTLGDDDNRDYYRFTLGASASVALTLKSISGNADLQLIRDANANGILDAGEVLATSANASGLDSIARTLGPGTYYIRVSRGGSSDSAYDLKIDA